MTSFTIVTKTIDGLFKCEINWDIAMWLRGKLYHFIVKSTNIYRPQTKLRKGNVFTSVCQEFCPERGSASVHAGIHTPSGQAPPSRAGTPPGGRSPHQTATVADGTHPTGMHSCLKIDSILIFVTTIPIHFIETNHAIRIAIVQWSAGVNRPLTIFINSAFCCQIISVRSIWQNYWRMSMLEIGDCFSHSFWG